jgi:hypothetical protein
MFIGDTRVENLNLLEEGKGSLDKDGSFHSLQ